MPGLVSHPYAAPLSTSYNINGTFAMRLVMMALIMGLNALMAWIEGRAFRWRAPTEGFIQTY